MQTSEEFNNYFHIFHIIFIFYKSINLDKIPEKIFDFFFIKFVNKKNE